MKPLPSRHPGRRGAGLLALGLATMLALAAACRTSEVPSSGAPDASGAPGQKPSPVAPAASAAPPAPAASAWAAPRLPDTRFMVISDLHYFSPSLQGSGSALERQSDWDHKLIKESPALLAEAGRRILEAKPAFVLVSGDLSKDGERASHQELAAAFATWEAAGIEVWLIPGNHDINNPQASRYEGEAAIPVPGLDAAGFAANYAAMGYAQAIARDPASLSYVAEPAPGLWLLALDIIQYEAAAGRERQVTAGRLRPATKLWLDGQLREAARQGKAVMVMQHQGLVEHFNGQALQFGDYLVDGHEELARWYAERRVNLVFTGHFHAQDIAGRWWPDGSWIMDIETGSLSAWPCPLRTVAFRDGRVEIASQTIAALPGAPSVGADFAAHARAQSGNAAAGALAGLLKRYGASAEETRVFSRQFRAAMLAHWAGDEAFVPNDPGLETDDQVFGMAKPGLIGRLLVTMRGQMVQGLWADPPPADLNLVVHPDGSWERP